MLVVPDRYDIEAYAEYKDENVIPFVDLKDLPPMDYIFQDETTSVRKGDQPDHEEAEAGDHTENGSNQQYSGDSGGREWNWVLYCCGRASDLYQPWRSSEGISGQRTGDFQCRRGLALQ